ncbi:MAG: thiolase family protein [Gammaproteobacteria bacterium]|nr:thiolase family protein [Gammaproteobacteria bacterium]
MTDVVIAGFVRSPFTPAQRGQLSRIRPDDLAAGVVAALMERSGVNGADIEDLILGCAFPEGEQGLNLARLVTFLSGVLPQSVAGVTVNRFCGSSMYAIHAAAGAIAMRAGEAFVCAGVESMSRVPMMGFNPLPNPALASSFPAAYISMGETAENVADRHGIDRRRQEELAVLSQQRASAAREAGRFDDELVAVRSGDIEVTQDGCIRPDTSTGGLAALAPAFKADGSVTAGTSSPLTDGAAAVLVCSADYAHQRGLEPLARILSMAVAGCDPAIMGMGPVVASRKALTRAGLRAAQIDIVELNEAFAAQALACMDELELSADKVNLDGGAIALGHPLGATGARITGKAAALLRREGKRYALATQCIGGGQGIATVLEAV